MTIVKVSKPKPCHANVKSLELLIHIDWGLLGRMANWALNKVAPGH